MSALLSSLFFISISIYSPKRCCTGHVCTQQRKTPFQGNSMHLIMTPCHAHIAVRGGEQTQGQATISRSEPKSAHGDGLAWAGLWGFHHQPPDCLVPLGKPCRQLQLLLLVFSYSAWQLPVHVPLDVCSQGFICHISHPHPGVWICWWVFCAQHTNVSQLPSNLKVTSPFLILMHCVCCSDAQTAYYFCAWQAHWNLISCSLQKVTETNISKSISMWSLLIQSTPLQYVHSLKRYVASILSLLALFLQNLITMYRLDHGSNELRCMRGYYQGLQPRLWSLTYKICPPGPTTPKLSLKSLYAHWILEKFNYFVKNWATAEKYSISVPLHWQSTVK